MWVAETLILGGAIVITIIAVGLISLIFLSFTVNAAISEFATLVDYAPTIAEDENES